MKGTKEKQRRSRSRMTKKTCRVCGRHFWSAGEGDICITPSTCRVKEHQQRQRAKLLAQEMILDMDYFISFQGVIAQRPTLKPTLELFVTTHGIPAAKANLAMLEAMLRGEI